MKMIATALLGGVMLLGACAAQPSAGLHQGLVAIHDGRYVDAEKHFAGMLARDPDDPCAMLHP
jgi:hypothetical protein